MKILCLCLVGVLGFASWSDAGVLCRRGECRRTPVRTVFRAVTRGGVRCTVTTTTTTETTSPAPVILLPDGTSYPPPAR